MNDDDWLNEDNIIDLQDPRLWSRFKNRVRNNASKMKWIIAVILIPTILTIIGILATKH